MVRVTGKVALESSQSLPGMLPGNARRSQKRERKSKRHNGRLCIGTSVESKE
jgi:hypothetical protein